MTDYRKAHAEALATADKAHFEATAPAWKAYAGAERRAKK